MKKVLIGFVLGLGLSVGGMVLMERLGDNQPPTETWPEAPQGPLPEMPPRTFEAPREFSSVLSYSLFRYDPQSRSFKKFAVTPWPKPIKTPTASWYAVPDDETALETTMAEVLQKKFPVFLKIKGDEHIGAIHGIHDYVIGLDCRGVTDLSFQIIGTMKNLEVLKCSGSVTDQGIKQLDPLPRLRMLRVAGNISDESLSTIARFKMLEDLEIWGAITTIGPLSGLRKLHRLSIWRTKITPRGMATVGRFENLRKFTLGYTLSREISRKGLSEAETEEIAGYLAQSRTLEELTLLYTRMGDGGIAKLLPLQSLRVLDMWRGTGTSVSSDGFRLFARFKKLEKLTVADWKKRISSSAKQWVKEQLPRCEIRITNGGM